MSEFRHIHNTAYYGCNRSNTLKSYCISEMHKFWSTNTPCFTDIRDPAMQKSVLYVMDVRVELQRKTCHMTCMQEFWHKKPHTVCYAWNCCAKYKECHTMTSSVQQNVNSGKIYVQCTEEKPCCCTNSEKLSANIKQNDIFFFINNERVKISLAKILYTNLH